MISKGRCINIKIYTTYTFKYENIYCDICHVWYIGIPRMLPLIGIHDKFSLFFDCIVFSEDPLKSHLFPCHPRLKTWPKELEFLYVLLLKELKILPPWKVPYQEYPSMDSHGTSPRCECPGIVSEIQRVPFFSAFPSCCNVRDLLLWEDCDQVAFWWVR